MKKLNYLLSFAIIFTLFNCKSEDDSEVPNSAPNKFTITVTEIQSSKAKLNWTQAIDPDGNTVSYSIELNDNIAVQNLSDLSYDLENLTNETSYNVKIIARDTKGAETFSTVSFSTSSLPVPQDFTISISEMDYTSATINWTESSTSENNAISYTILVNNEVVQENITNLSYEISSLEHNTDYIGQVRAIADNGQILMKDFEFKTLQNIAPESFELVYFSSYGFAAASFRFNEANDPEDDILEYRVILNNNDVTETLFDLSSAPTPTFNHSIYNLDGNTNYELKIKAVDPFGNESFSNSIDILTDTTPPDNFNIDVYYVQGQIRLVWDRLTETGYTVGTSNGQPSGSVYILDGVEYDLGSALTRNNTTESTAQFNTDLISPNEDHELQLVLDWGFNNKKSYSNIVSVNNKIYSATTVEVNTVNIYNSTAQFFPLQFAITFKDALISEFEDYEISEIKFHDKTFQNYVFFEQGAQNKGYLTGNITQEDFNYLSQFNDGYIETKDENGYHKIEFQYTINN